MALKIRPVESYAAENSPKFFSSKPRQAKFIASLISITPSFRSLEAAFLRPFSPRHLLTPCFLLLRGHFRNRLIIVVTHSVITNTSLIQIPPSPGAYL